MPEGKIIDLVDKISRKRCYDALVKLGESEEAGETRFSNLMMKKCRVNVRTPQVRGFMGCNPVHNICNVSKKMIEFTLSCLLTLIGKEKDARDRVEMFFRSVSTDLGEDVRREIEQNLRHREGNQTNDKDRKVKIGRLIGRQAIRFLKNIRKLLAALLP